MSHGLIKRHRKNADLCELKAFIGLLLYSALFKTFLEKFIMLFDSDYTRRGNVYFMMKKKRFETLSPYLIFDNPNDSEQHGMIPLL
jgi:hypothetical protein